MLKFRTLLALCIALLVSAFLAPGSVQAKVNPNGKLVLHLVPISKQKKKRKNTCFEHGVRSAADVLTEGKLYPQHYLAYVLIADFDTTQGITGVQFGISYDDSLERGVDIFSWQHCTLYEWPMDDWPAANTGNLLTWNQRDDCQKTEPLTVGFFYLTAYSPDRLKLIPRPVDGLARIAACGINGVNSNEKLDDIKAENLGWVDFGGGKGYNPWDPDQNLLNLRKRFQPVK